MKHNQTRIFALITALFLLLLPIMVSAEASDIVGTWYLNVIQDGGDTVSPATYDLENVRFILEEGGAALMQAADEEDERGTWSVVNGEVIIVSDNSDDTTLILAESSLSFEMDGTKFIFSKDKPETVAASIEPSRLEGMSMADLLHETQVVNIAMNSRDRSSDTPLFRVDDEHFVSEEDVSALLEVLTVRRALQKASNFSRGPAPTADIARDFLICELLLTAKAQEIGYNDLEEDVRYYIREGWLQPEPPTPDASDITTIVQHGLMRARLWRGALTSAQDNPMPYEGSVPLIDALVTEMYQQFQ